MSFELPALPWASDTLEPHLSAKTIGFHHGKHHNAYITNLNNLVEGSPLAEKSLEELIKETAGANRNARASKDAPKPNRK